MIAELQHAVALRAPTTADADELFARVDACRKTLRAWLPWVDATDSADDSRAFLESVSAGKSPAWLIEVDGRIGGMIDIHGICKVNRIGHIGYWLADGHVGRGIMQQALSRVQAIAFDELGLHRLAIIAARENRRSCAAAERQGFKLEGMLREHLLLDGRRWDACHYGLLASERRAS